MLGEALSLFCIPVSKNVQMYKQNLMKIFHAVKDLLTFLLKELNGPKLCLVEPRHRSAFQRLENVKIHLYTKYTTWFKSYEHFIE